MSNIRTQSPAIVKRPKYSPEKQKIAYDRAIMAHPLCAECTFNSKDYIVEGKITCTYCSIYGKILRRLPMFGFHENCKHHSKKRGKKNNNDDQA